METELIILLFTSLILGLIHGFDPDHIMVVTNFVSQNSQPKKALLFGLNFGLGHSLTVFIFGTLVLSLKVVIPSNIGELLESMVGIVLILMGFWVIWGVVKRRYNEKENKDGHFHHHQHGGLAHDHSHKHSFHHDHAHNKAQYRMASLVGAVVGLAGTAGVMLFGPVLKSPNVFWASLNIAFYGIGVIFSMSIYGYLISKLYLLTWRSKIVSQTVVGLTGALSVILGILWTIGIL